MSITKSQGYNICKVSAVSQGDLGDVAGLSKAHHAKLMKMFPHGPQHTTADGPAVSIDGNVGVVGTPADPEAMSYGKTYRSAVMRGFSPATLGGEVVDMSYGTTPSPVLSKQPPNLQALNPPNIGLGPEKESTQGADGSTISASGLGPNVNPLPEDDISSRVMADIKPSVDGVIDTNVTSPSTTSAEIADDDVLLLGEH